MPKNFAFGKRKRSKPRGIHAIRSASVETPVEDILSSTQAEPAALPLSNGHDVNTDGDNQPALLSNPARSISSSSPDPNDQRPGPSTRAESKPAFFAGTFPPAPNIQKGYHIIHHDVLLSILDLIVCPGCRTGKVHLIVTQQQGLSQHFSLVCDICDTSIWSQHTSSVHDKHHDINLRTVLACKESGIGYNQLFDLLSLMNVSASMCHKTFHKIEEKIHDAVVAQAEVCMNKAAAVVRERYFNNPGPSTRLLSSGCPVIDVTFDGTWQKRGHSSHNGVGIVIDIETGLVLDYSVLSNFCKECHLGPQPSSSNYLEWKVQHKPVCHANHQGSSNSMEVGAALETFGRSVNKRSLVYGTMLCDGDSKAITSINERNIYDIPVLKEDCVNHIAKRMFNALDNLKKTNKKELNRKLTKVHIEKITNTYATNLKLNAPNVEKMKRGVLGGILHMASTDEAPNHRYCPEGITSWCKYNRAKAKGEPVPSHTPTIRPDVLPLLYPVIRRLTEPELLERCVRMKTQNQNESFNSLIWRRCSKNVFVTRPAVETATALAVISFNVGPYGMRQIMSRLGISWSTINEENAHKKLHQKVKQANKRTTRASKWARKKAKLDRITKEQAAETEEGETYQSGGFNL